MTHLCSTHHDLIKKKKKFSDDLALKTSKLFVKIIFGYKFHIKIWAHFHFDLLYQNFVLFVN